MGFTKKLACSFAFAVFLTVGALAQTVSIPKVANIPWTFSEDNKTAIGTVCETIKSIFNHCGLDCLEEGKIIAVWSQMTKSPPDANGLPSDQDMIKLGQKLGVQYVAAGKLDWKVKTVWLIKGVKTKADATVWLKVVDVRKNAIATEKSAIKADSSARDNDLAIAASVIVFLPTAFLSGGPKTPHMQRSGSLATALALNEFYLTHASKAELDQGGRKAGTPIKR